MLIGCNNRRMNAADRSTGLGIREAYHRRKHRCDRGEVDPRRHGHPAERLHPEPKQRADLDGLEQELQKLAEVRDCKRALLDNALRNLEIAIAGNELNGIIAAVDSAKDAAVQEVLELEADDHISQFSLESPDEVTTMQLTTPINEKSSSIRTIRIIKLIS